ncbi:unnamed protein product [Penicillium pancosmium]
MCARDTPAADTYSDHPDYPEEVALYPSSRVSSSPSVTGLDGPGTSRVFDVFQDDPAEHKRENVRVRSSLRGKKRALERPDFPRKRPQTRHLHTSDPEITTTRRCSPKERPLQDEESHSHKQSGLRESIRYLEYCYGLASAQAQFSDDLVDGGINKENLVVLQNAIKFVQHSCGIIATSNLFTNEPENDLSTTRRRHSATSQRWESEEEHLLSDLKDAKNLEWSSIFCYFPERSRAAKERQPLKQRKRSKKLSPASQILIRHPKKSQVESAL